LDILRARNELKSMNKPKEEVIMTVVGLLICLGLEGDESWATA
jgi:hypothetical protein